jgi:hypothetical protein
MTAAPTVVGGEPLRALILRHFPKSVVLDFVLAAGPAWRLFGWSRLEDDGALYSTLKFTGRTGHASQIE